MFRKSLLTLSLMSLVSLSGGLRADDTDIYTQEGVDLPPESAPMVMFSVDYRPNLGSTSCQGGACNFLVNEGYLPNKPTHDFFDLLRGALGKVLDQVSGVRVGLMLNHDHRNNCAGKGINQNPNQQCSNGGYIAMGFDDSPLTELAAGQTCAPFKNGNTPDLSACPDPVRAKLLNILWNMPTSNGVRTHSFQGKELFFEFYRYLTGGEIYNGHTGFTSYDGNEGNNKENLDLPDSALKNLPQPILTNRFMWDTEIESNGRYIDPFLPGAECTRVYTVNFMFQVSNQDDDSDSAINQSVANGGFGWGNRKNFRFEDVIGYLHNTDLEPNVSDSQNVTSYFLLKEPFFSNRTGGLYAQAGGTGAPLPLSENPEELIGTLTDVFKQILSVSTTFVAASIPVNSFNRAEVLDNVYLALFQPNEDKRPYWFGNVKKLKLQGLAGGGTVFLADANGDPAVSAEDGRIRFTALTYWTDPTAADVLAHDADKGEVPGKDGRSVNRGGAGHKIKGYRSGSVGLSNGSGGRTLYYDSNDTTLSAFDATSSVASALQSDLGAATSTEALTLLKYARGYDMKDEDADGSVDDTRPWLFASSLHSRPFPVNYGARGSHTKANPDVRILVGTNDGFMRMLRNTPAGASGPETGDAYGEEIWAFAPRRVMRVHKYLHDLAFNTSAKHSYAVDEAPVIYIKENGDGTIQSGETVWAFFGLRRGGAAYYGMDISDPDNPDLMWVIHPGKAGFGNLGLTFSTPVVGQVMVSGVETPVLIFGGGYDTGYDDEKVPFGLPAGSNIFVVNAQTGALLRAFGAADGMLDSVPSQVSATDLDGDGLTDRIYVGDLGGVVWRADLVNTGDPADWQLTKLASFGRQAGQPDRRFYHKPDVVKSKDVNGNFDAVLVGSGNREDPLETSIDNFFYMIKDKNTLSPPPVGSLPYLQGDLEDISACTDCATAADLANGWKLELSASGEKSLATPLTLGGVVFFTTYIPQGGSTGDACAPPEGTGRLYAVGLQSGNPLVNRDRPIQDQGDSGTPEDRYETLRSAGIPSEVVAVPPNRILRPDLQVQPVPVSTRWRTFWYPTEEPAN